MSKNKNFQIYLKNEDRTESVQSYRQIGDKYEVTFIGGKTFIYNANNVRLVVNEADSEECLHYLKSVADEIGIKIRDDEGRDINILSSVYSKISVIVPDSVLHLFASGKLNSTKSQLLKQPIENIYPFGFNVSQKKGVDKALVNQLSIIEGPPGTGKTQTILNIIANAVMRGESVAVVSSNNSATKNIFEKLQKNHVDFIVAYLGNATNKADFINSQKPRPDLTKWEIAPEFVEKMKVTLKQSYEALEKNLLKQQALSALKQDLTAAEIEYEHFLRYSVTFENLDYLTVTQGVKTSEMALELWLTAESEGILLKVEGIVSFIRKILEIVKFWKRREQYIRKLLKQYSCDYLVTAFQHKFFELKISELRRDIATLENKLSSFDFNVKMQEYTDISMQIFRATLAEKYAENKYQMYVLDDLWKKSDKFISDYPVILSTTYSLRTSLSDLVMYDYVIIDESSQVDLCTGALALSCARRAVVVGDLMQLPHVVDLKTSKATDSIFSKYNLSEVYRYKNHSLLSTLIELFPEAPRTLLREHYRCHPKIIEFCNKKFYGGQLIVLTEQRTGRDPLIVYKTVEGNHARNRINQRQIDIIKHEIIFQQSLNTTDGSLGIITPYRNQTDALQSAFTGTSIKADTVDKFQGQENEIVILSTVDNEISDFADNANRLNVAVSRAIDQLIVVVNDSDTLKDKNIGDLVRYIEYNNFEVVESKVYSVFDYLYRSYMKRRREFLAKNKRVSEYDSENLMYALITDVLQEKKICHLEVATHVPLRMIIRDTYGMTPGEEKYILNILSHVDFLIFDSVTKSPMLAIEVDGVAFHRRGTRQADRDIIKNNIFKKCELPLLRFSTDGSRERERLSEVLDKVL